MNKRAKRRDRRGRRTHRPDPTVVPNSGISPLGVSARRDPALAEFGKAVREFVRNGADFNAAGKA